MKASRIRLTGAGRAYGSVAQSAAIAIGDATDYLRNLSTLSTSALGVALVYAAKGEVPKVEPIITAATAVTGMGVAQFSAVGAAATAVLQGFAQTLS